MQKSKDPLQKKTLLKSNNMNITLVSLQFLKVELKMDMASKLIKMNEEIYIERLTCSRNKLEWRKQQQQQIIIQ